MPLYINTNQPSLTAQRSISKTSDLLNQTFQRLSSGLRVNSARDDAAGLAIGNRMSATIRGLNQSVRNANDAVSMAQVAEGALEETSNALLRIRELAVQASNDTNTGSDRNNLQDEVNVLIDEVDRIAAKTKFNSTLLLNGTMTFTYHVGAERYETVALTLTRANMTTLAGVGATSSISVQTTGSAENVISYMDTALTAVNTMRSKLGSYQNRFTSVVANLTNVSENLSAARSRIMDADIAEETAILTRTSILQQAGTAVLAQANQQPQLALQLLG